MRPRTGWVSELVPGDLVVYSDGMVILKGRQAKNLPQGLRLLLFIGHISTLALEDVPPSFPRRVSIRSMFLDSRIDIPARCLALRMSDMQQMLICFTGIIPADPPPKRIGQVLAEHIPHAVGPVLKTYDGIRTNFARYQDNRPRAIATANLWRTMISQGSTDGVQPIDRTFLEEHFPRVPWYRPDPELPSLTVREYSRRQALSMPP
jgi:hypothetical protein